MLVDRISLTNKSTAPAHRLFRLITASTLGRQLTVEFIGTFILVLTVGLSTSTNDRRPFLDDEPKGTA
jgi:glycerol uptake facilitator-like aquaporin